MDFNGRGIHANRHVQLVGTKLVLALPKGNKIRMHALAASVSFLPAAPEDGMRALRREQQLGSAEGKSAERPLAGEPHMPVPVRPRAYSQQGGSADGYQALRIAESRVAEDIRRPAAGELVADMAARDRRRTLTGLHHFSRQLGVPA